MIYPSLTINSRETLRDIESVGIISLGFGSDGTVLDNVRCRGLHLHQTSGVTINLADIYDPLAINPDIKDAEHIGIWLRDCENISTYTSRVDSADGKAFSIGRCKRITLRDCTALNAGMAGLYFMESEDCMVDGFRVINPRMGGLAIKRGSQRIAVRNSLLTAEGKGFAAYIQGASDNTISDSTIIGRNERPAIRIEQHPADMRWSADRNAILGNRIYGPHPMSPHATHEESIARGTIYRDNLEAE